MLTQTLQDACSPNAYLDYIKKEGVSLKKKDNCGMKNGMGQQILRTLRRLGHLRNMTF